MAKKRLHKGSRTKITAHLDDDVDLRGREITIVTPAYEDQDGRERAVAMDDETGAPMGVRTDALKHGGGKKSFFGFGKLICRNVRKDK